MALNKHKKHLYVSIEDRANELLWVGFVNNLRVNSIKAQALNVSGGWLKALEEIEYLELEKYKKVIVCLFGIMIMITMNVIKNLK